MSPTVTILLLWIGFAGTHLALSSLAIRQWFVGRIGEQAFRALYSVTAFAFFIPLVWTYFAHKHAGPWLWTVPSGPVLQWVVNVGMAIAFILLVSAFVRPSPASIVGGDATPTGAFRITRHPLLMSIAIFALLHLLPNGSAGDVIFFGGFVVFVLIGAWHQDQRKLAVDAAGFRPFHEATPFIPFSGRETVQGIRELSPVVVGLGVALTIILRYFHGTLFGG